jgi:lipid-binding SYLF domain-containing protein
MKTRSKIKAVSLLFLSVLACVTSQGTYAASLNGESRGALRQLVAQNPAARKVSASALAVLVFPKVVKAGFMVRAQEGEGVLLVNGAQAGRYRTIAASYGFQAGVQKFGYALFFMNQKAVDWVNSARGWSIGTGPSVVLVDKGMARTINSETLHSGIYAFTFDQEGLMAGMGVQGSKITKLD